MRSSSVAVSAVVALAITTGSAQATTFALGPPRPPVSNLSPFPAGLRRSRRGEHRQLRLPERRGGDARRGQSPQPRTTSWASGNRTAGTTAARTATGRATRTNGGMSWVYSAPAFSQAAPAAPVPNTVGTLSAPTDPWVSVQPEWAAARHLPVLRQLHATQRCPRRNIRTAAARPGARRGSWRFDDPRALGNNFNDKETLTADPFNPSLVYATWQRIVSPSERVSQEGLQQRRQLPLGGVVHALDQRRRVVGAGAGHLPPRAAS